MEHTFVSRLVTNLMSYTLSWAIEYGVHLRKYVFIHPCEENNKHKQFDFLNAMIPFQSACLNRHSSKKSTKHQNK